MGKKLTTSQLRTICTVARDIRDDSGSRKKSVTVYNMKWTDAIKKASKLVLKQDEQGAKRIEKPKRRKGKK
jgi:fructose-specific phosphotransferase system component IIB